MPFEESRPFCLAPESPMILWLEAAQERACDTQQKPQDIHYIWCLEDSETATAYAKFLVSNLGSHPKHFCFIFENLSSIPPESFGINRLIDLPSKKNVQEQTPKIS